MHITISRLDARALKLHRAQIAKANDARQTKRWNDRDHPASNPPKMRDKMYDKASRRSRSRLLAL